VRFLEYICGQTRIQTDSQTDRRTDTPQDQCLKWPARDEGINSNKGHDMVRGVPFPMGYGIER